MILISMLANLPKKNPNSEHYLYNLPALDPAANTPAYFMLQKYRTHFHEQERERYATVIKNLLSEKEFLANLNLKDLDRSLKNAVMDAFVREAELLEECEKIEAMRDTCATFDEMFKRASAYEAVEGLNEEEKQEVLKNTVVDRLARYTQELNNLKEIPNPGLRYGILQRLTKAMGDLLTRLNNTPISQANVVANQPLTIEQKIQMRFAQLDLSQEMGLEEKLHRLEQEIDKESRMDERELRVLLNNGYLQALLQQKERGTFQCPAPLKYIEEALDCFDEPLSKLVDNEMIQAIVSDLQHENLEKISLNELHERAFGAITQRCAVTPLGRPKSLRDLEKIRGELTGLFAQATIPQLESLRSQLEVLKCSWESHQDYIHQQPAFYATLWGQSNPAFIQKEMDQTIEQVDAKIREINQRDAAELNLYFERQIKRCSEMESTIDIEEVLTEALREFEAKKYSSDLLPLYKAFRAEINQNFLRELHVGTMPVFLIQLAASLGVEEYKVAQLTGQFYRQEAEQMVENFDLLRQHGPSKIRSELDLKVQKRVAEAVLDMAGKEELKSALAPFVHMLVEYESFFNLQMNAKERLVKNKKDSDEMVNLMFIGFENFKAKNPLSTLFNRIFETEVGKPFADKIKASDLNNVASVLEMYRKKWTAEQLFNYDWEAFQNHLLLRYLEEDAVIEFISDIEKAAGFRIDDAYLDQQHQVFLGLVGSYKISSKMRKEYLEQYQKLINIRYLHTFQRDLEERVAGSDRGSFIPLSVETTLEYLGLKPDARAQLIQSTLAQYVEQLKGKKMDYNMDPLKFSALLKRELSHAILGNLKNDPHRLSNEEMARLGAFFKEIEKLEESLSRSLRLNQSHHRALYQEIIEEIDNERIDKNFLLKELNCFNVPSPFPSIIRKIYVDTARNILIQQGQKRARFNLLDFLRNEEMFEQVMRSLTKRAQIEERVWKETECSSYYKKKYEDFVLKLGHGKESWAAQNAKNMVFAFNQSNWGSQAILGGGCVLCPYLSLD